MIAHRAFPGARLGQTKEDEQPRHGREQGGDQEWEAEPPFVSKRDGEKQTSHERAQHEAQPEGHADQAHAPGAVFGRGHVGDVRLRDQDVAARCAVEHASQEHDPEVARKAQDQKRERCPRLAEDQQRPAAMAIAQPAQDRARHELANRIRRKQETNLPLAETIMIGKRRQKGHDERKPEQIDEYDQHNDPERRHRSSKSSRRLGSPAECVGASRGWVGVTQTVLPELDVTAE